MATKNETSQIFNVNKPRGMSSYDVVRKVKHILNYRKIGHGGTLDPFAEGVLLILVGKATKRMNELLSHSKSYEGVLKLGEATKSGDPTTPVIKQADIPVLTSADLERVRPKFIGEMNQFPPRFSAKKVNGQRAYRLARKNIEFVLPPQKISIEEMNLTMIDSSTIKIEVTCSSGTYIRKLGEDIALALGTVGHLTALRRTRIGEYYYENSIPYDELENALLHGEIGNVS